MLKWYVSNIFAFEGTKGKNVDTRVVNCDVIFRWPLRSNRMLGRATSWPSSADAATRTPSWPKRSGGNFKSYPEKISSGFNRSRWQRCRPTGSRRPTRCSITPSSGGAITAGQCMSFKKLEIFPNKMTLCNSTPSLSTIIRHLKIYREYIFTTTTLGAQRCGHCWHMVVVKNSP